MLQISQTFKLVYFSSNIVFALFTITTFIFAGKQLPNMVVDAKMDLHDFFFCHTDMYTVTGHDSYWQPITGEQKYIQL
jgi:hypothetical protein